MIDSTTVRGHPQATGAKGGLIRRAFGRSRGGFTTKIHARTDGQGRPLGFVPTGGETSDNAAVPDLLAMPVGKPRLFLADKGYDGDAIREELLIHGIKPVISTQSEPQKPAIVRFQSLQGSQSYRADVQ
nr:transposase [Rhizobium leguminosarum]